MTPKLKELSQTQASIPLWRGTDSTALQSTAIFQMLGQMTGGNMHLPPHSHEKSMARLLLLKSVLRGLSTEERVD